MTLHMIYEEMISLYILERVKIKCITLNQFLCDKILHNENGTENGRDFPVPQLILHLREWRSSHKTDCINFKK